MAKCGECGADVGCGCNLNKGKCPSCYSRYLEQVKNNELIKKIHVSPKTK